MYGKQVFIISIKHKQITVSFNKPSFFNTEKWRSFKKFTPSECKMKTNNKSIERVRSIWLITSVINVNFCNTEFLLSLCLHKKRFLSNNET